MSGIWCLDTNLWHLLFVTAEQFNIHFQLQNIPSKLSTEVASQDWHNPVLCLPCFSVLLQLPLALQLPMGLLQWWLYMITTDAFARTLDMPLATTRDWALGGLLCFLVPSVYVYVWEKKLYHQYLQQCGRVGSDAGGSISSRMQHAVIQDRTADEGSCKQESATTADAASSSTVKSTSSLRSLKSGICAMRQLGIVGNTTLEHQSEAVGSSDAHSLSAPPSRAPARAAAAPGPPATSLPDPEASAGTRPVTEVGMTTAPRRVSAVPLYRSPLVHKTISVKVRKDVLQCSLAPLQLPLLLAFAPCNIFLVISPRRTKQAIEQHVERHVVPFSGWEAGGSPLPRWWEPPPAPTRVLLDPAASPPPMCDGSGAGFRF